MIGDAGGCGIALAWWPAGSRAGVGAGGVARELRCD